MLVASQGGNRGSPRAQPRLERPAGDKPSWSAGSRVLPHQVEFEQAGGEGHLQQLMLEGVRLGAFFFFKAILATELEWGRNGKTGGHLLGLLGS